MRHFARWLRDGGLWPESDRYRCDGCGVDMVTPPGLWGAAWDDTINAGVIPQCWVCQAPIEDTAVLRAGSHGFNAELRYRARGPQDTYTCPVCHFELQHEAGHWDDPPPNDEGIHLCICGIPVQIHAVVRATR